jgi:hypothetical protein
MRLIRFRLVRLALALTVASICIGMYGSSASAINYNRDAARQYADQYWSILNPSYRYISDNDCTNFISQVLKAGGVPHIGTSYTGAIFNPDSWIYINSGAWSHSWSVAMENYPNFPTGGLVGHAYRYLGNRFDRNLYISTLEAGDFVMFDATEPTNGLATHGRIGVGWFIYGSQGYTYLMNQHSPSRYHVPWNHLWNPNLQNNWKISVHD